MRLVKATPVNNWTDVWSSRRLRLPEFLHSQHMKVAKLSALCTGCLYPPRGTSCTHFC